VKLLVFGSTGQVARELARHRPAHFDATFLSRRDVDLSQPERCAEAIRSHKPDAVINAAAWTAVDAAEASEKMAAIVNGDAPGHMAQACAERGIPFLHLSTDYVFDGAGHRPLEPDHDPSPLQAYGRSKLAGELAVRSAGGRYLILRTSWVVSAHSPNFVTTMLKLGRERDELKVVADQFGGPTPAAAIAGALYDAIDQLTGGAPGGIHHFSGQPDTSWADFARAIMQAAGLSCRIRDIPSAEYPTPARRPLNSRLDCAGFERQFGVSRPDWNSGLHEILKELGVVR